jgi:hypothetical protein
MEPEQADQGESKGAASPKRPYVRPEIRRLGTVRELTLTPGHSNVADASAPFTPGKTSP